MDPLDKARGLILSITTQEDAKVEITKFSTLPETIKKQALDAYFATMPDVAASGNVEAVSIALRVFEHFGDKSHDRMLLHYIAQAAANNALEELKSETHPNHKDMVTALTLISEAFADANAFDQTK